MPLTFERGDRIAPPHFSEQGCVLLYLALDNYYNIYIGLAELSDKITNFSKHFRQKKNLPPIFASDITKYYMSILASNL